MNTAPELPKSKSLLGLVAFGTGARLFALASQFVVLILMSRMLSRNEFGDLMIVFAFYRIAALGLGTGIGSLVLYHVGRAGGDADLDTRIHRTALLVSLGITTVLAALVWGAADQVAQIFGKPGLAVWLRHMAPLLIFYTASTVSMGSLEGRSRINASIVMNEVAPNAIRLAVLPIVAFLDWPELLIGHILWASLVPSWLVVVIPLFSPRVSGLAQLSLWDVRYAGYSAATTMAGLQLQGLDLLVVGALFSSETAAAYAIASRLATLYPFLQQILLRNFTPRAGLLIQRADIDTLNRELAEIKVWSTVAVFGLTGAILTSAPIAVRLFGDYRDALPMLIALASPTVVRCLFAGLDVVLKMSGRAGTSFAVALSSAAFVLIAPAMLAGTLSIYAVPVGMLLSAVIVNVIAAQYVSRQGIRLVRVDEIPLVAAGCLGLMAGLSVPSPDIGVVIAGIWLGGLALFTVIRSRYMNRTKIK